MFLSADGVAAITIADCVTCLADVTTLKSQVVIALF